MSEAMRCDWDTFKALAVPLFQQHGAEDDQAKILAEDLWNQIVSECKKQVQVNRPPKKRSSGKSGWGAWSEKKKKQKLKEEDPLEGEGGVLWAKSRNRFAQNTLIIAADVAKQG
eukprot:s2652_g3.t1